MVRNYFYEGLGSFIEITNLGSSTKLHFYGRGVSISICDSLSVIDLGKLLRNVDFSNLESKLRNFLLKLEYMNDEIDEYANREIRIIHDKFIETIKRADFTSKMLNDVSFHVSLVKSARNNLNS